MTNSWELDIFTFASVIANGIPRTPKAITNGAGAGRNSEPETREV